MRQFRHLNVPEHWEQYWSKYPQGYTILEALISWVSQVDSMVDNQNSLNTQVEGFKEQLTDFLDRFDPKLKVEVERTLKEWQVSGFLDIVISDALQTEIDTKVNISDFNTANMIIDNKIDSLNNGFKGAENTLAALQAKYPTGAAGFYIVKNEMKWYYWDGSWLVGGAFPENTTANEAISQKHILRNSLNENAVNFIDKGTNLYSDRLAIKGYYIGENNGRLQYNASGDFDSMLAYAKGNTDYYLSTSDFYYYFFDTDYNVLGFAGNASGVQNGITFRTPLNTAYIGFSVKKTNLNYNSILLVEGTTLPTEVKRTVLNPSIRVTKDQLLVKRQLIDPSTAINNQYAVQVKNIPVRFGTQYKNNIGFKTGAAGVKPYIFYNDKGQIIQDTEYGVGVPIPSQITPPLGAVSLTLNIFKSFPGFTFNINDIERVMMFEGTYVPDYYVPFGEEIDNYVFKPKYYQTVASKVLEQSQNPIITVKKDGTGDVTTVKAGLAAAVYGTNVNIHSGTYNLTDEHTAAEFQAADFYGYMTKAGVNLIGIGDRDTVIIKGDLPVGTAQSHVDRISTLHVVDGNIRVENIKFIGGNVRYAMHDDDARTRGNVHFKYCTFTKEKNKGTYPTAVGGGWYDYGTHKTFDTCTFETLWDNMYKDHSPISYHSRTNQTKPHTLEFIRCVSKISGQGSHLRYGGMKGSAGVNSNLVLTQNRFNRIFLMEEGYTAVGIDIQVIGQGNKSDLQVSTRLTDGQYAPKLDILEPYVTRTYEENWTN